MKVQGLIDYLRKQDKNASVKIDVNSLSGEINCMCDIEDVRTQTFDNDSRVYLLIMIDDE